MDPRHILSLLGPLLIATCRTETPGDDSNEALAWEAADHESRAVDRILRDGYAGIFNSRPLTKNSVRTYSEYMWQHTFLLALVTNQGTDKCDLFEIVDWVFSVDKSNGHLTKEFNPLFQFEAEVVDRVPQKCG